MVTTRSQMHSLTTDQKAELVSLINEQFGTGLKFDVFADKALGLFEDIPGFETMPQRKASRLVNQLWRQYRGKEQIEGQKGR